MPMRRVARRVMSSARFFWRVSSDVSSRILASLKSAAETYLAKLASIGTLRSGTLNIMIEWIALVGIIIFWPV